jgi:hypothetical protein
MDVDLETARDAIALLVDTPHIVIVDLRDGLSILWDFKHLK